MYPHLVYMSKPGERYKMYPVWIRGYQQGISSDAFKSRTMNAAYDACHAGFGYPAYDALPNHEFAFAMEERLKTDKAMANKFGMDTKYLYDIQEKEYELFDFYKEIGYDKSTGKINGRTLRQHIKYFLKEKQS